MSTTRRFFLTSMAGCGLAGLLHSSRPASVPAPRSAAGARIEVLPEDRLGRIAPEIYGHFIEHLGGVIYDGVWVGENSKIANDGGIRQALIDALKGIHAPVIRWPGGCFADSYDWHDGVGLAAQRPARTNFWGGADSNAFGTHEFLRLCETAGAQPYLAANLRSAPAKDFNEWIEYCNSPAGTTSAAKRRAANGHPAPFQVRYWGVGNESWGCGGNFTPEEYAAEFRRFTAWVPRYGQPLSLIASGPSSDDLAWTRRLMRSMEERRQVASMFGLSLHHYTWNLSGGTSSDWDRAKGDALKFDDFEWYELLSQGDALESFIRDHWEAMAEFDPKHAVKLIVDEWGAWYRPGTEIGKKYALSQMPTLRDALLSGLTLDLFHRQAGKVAMANAAQLVNCLHSLILASEDKFALTPNYHVFKMYMPHMGAQAVRSEFTAPPMSYDRKGKPGSLWGLNGSASVSGKEVTLTAVNPHLKEPVETEIVVRGVKVKEARGLVLTNADIHAHNDFSQPDSVQPAAVNVTVRDGRIVHDFPPASVTALYLTLL